MTLLPAPRGAPTAAPDPGGYFPTLFQRFLETLKSDDCQMYAKSLGGYDFQQCGQIIWSD